MNTSRNTRTNKEICRCKLSMKNNGKKLTISTSLMFPKDKTTKFSST